MSNLFEHLDIEFEELNKLGIVEITMLKGEKGDVGYPTDAQVEQAVDEWLDEHPEATTTVEDGSITEKKFANGVLENMLVGTANQLLSTNFVKESEPYLFRTAGGNKEIGNRENDTIVGVSLPWNQLARNGNFENTSVWLNRAKSTFSVSNNIGHTTITGTPSNALEIGLASTFSGIVQGHKYLLSVDAKPSKSLSLSMFITNSQTPKYIFSAVANIWNSLKGVCIAATSSNFNLGGGNNDYASWENGDTIDYRNVQIIDLTTLFGTTIADYIYSLEQSNAGAGVAWFKKLFPKDYYAYNAGEMLHVSGLQSHDMVGFNQWDEEWEQGGISTADGQNTSTSGYYRSTNYISVLPNTKYYFKFPVLMQVLEYGSSKNYLRNANPQNEVFTIPSDVYYIRFRNSSANTWIPYNHDICINLHWDGERDGEYEPYVKHSYPLDSSLTLRGISKLDSSNNLYYDGDTYEHDGIVTRKYSIIDLGTLTWTKKIVSNVTYFDSSNIEDIKNKMETTVPNDIVCAKYPLMSASIAQMGEFSKGITRYLKYVAIRDTSFDDATALKNALSGVYLVYELATPTTETAESFADPQIVDNWGTEEYVTTSIVSVGHDTKYYEDLKGKIESLPWNLSMIAPVETGTKASKAYSIGQYFLLNHQFCKAKTSIASGTTFTLNTNYEVTTVANELYTALHS